VFLGLLNGLFISDLPTIVLYAFLISHTPATFPRWYNPPWIICQ
jgi:hypothetical protein